MKNIAVLGADTLIGGELIRILETRNYPTGEVYLSAVSERPIGPIVFKDRPIDLLGDYDSFLDKVDLVFCCLDRVHARAAVSKFKKKALVIDCSGAFGLVHDVLHIIPEINGRLITEHTGIVANPDPVTVQLLITLYPLHKIFGLKRLHITTFSTVSGLGQDALDELDYEYEYLAMKQDVEKSEGGVFPCAIGGNVIPQIGDFVHKGYTDEEMKVTKEITEILGKEDVLLSVTCVWVPVKRANSVVLYADFEKDISVAEVKRILKGAPGVKLIDHDEDYPTPEYVSGKDEVFVGRIRQDKAFKNGLAMWIVADNLRKGSALNAVQIAELL